MMDWESLRDTALHCTACKLCQGRNHVVFGVGNPKAEIMFIGEGPGQHEDEQGIPFVGRDEQGEPFVGRSGQLMDKMLHYIDLDRSRNIYIANIVKCRPPQNRDPEQEEIAACMGYLRNQVALIRPKIIVCVGRIAAMTLIQPDYKVTRQHGEWIQKNGVWMMGTFHPAALLRNPYNTKNGFADFLSLREKIQELGIKI